MDILFTAFALACFLGTLLGLTRATKAADLAHGHYLKAEGQSLALKAERDRVTVLERDVEALRRELRKLSGKFYATQRERDERDERDENDERASQHFGPPVNDKFVVWPKPCENWQAAQMEGPHSTAARCECIYCVTQRRIRATEKAAILAARAATKPVNGGE